MSGKLTLVATPIGNLEDISIRAVKALKECDFIAAEDTRVTGKLLNHFDIKKSLTSYYEHNAREKGDELLQKIKSGQNCVLVTDAGMPAISDPGELLVKLCYKNNITVTVIPGACAAVSALAISGLDTARFVFEGFLSVNKNKRTKRLSELQNEKRTMIFYEAPHKLIRTLNDLYEVFGDRDVSLVRELTKIHEEVIRTTLAQAIFRYNENNRPKGEFVLIVSGNTAQPEEVKISIEKALELVQDFIKSGESLKTASKKTAELTGLKKRDIYNAFLKL